MTDVGTMIGWKIELEAFGNVVSLTVEPPGFDCT